MVLIIFLSYHGLIVVIASTPQNLKKIGASLPQGNFSKLKIFNIAHLTIILGQTCGSDNFSFTPWVDTCNSLNSSKFEENWSLFASGEFIKIKNFQYWKFNNYFRVSLWF